MNLVDPDGRKLRITGEQQDATLKLLSELFGSELHLEDNHVIITNEPKQYNTNSKLISEIINNENIVATASITRKFYKNGIEVFGESSFDWIFWFVKYNDTEFAVQKFDNRKNDVTR